MLATQETSRRSVASHQGVGSTLGLAVHIRSRSHMRGRVGVGRAYSQCPERHSELQAAHEGIGLVVGGRGLHAADLSCALISAALAKRARVG